jgi:hypothetical protein
MGASGRIRILLIMAGMLNDGMINYPGFPKPEVSQQVIKNNHDESV